MSLKGQELSAHWYGLDDGLPFLECNRAFINNGKMYVLSGREMVLFDGFGPIEQRPEFDIPIDYLSSPLKTKEGYLFYSSGESRFVYFDFNQWHIIEENPDFEFWYEVNGQTYLVNEKDSIFLFKDDIKGFKYVDQLLYDKSNIAPGDEILYVKISRDSSTITHGIRNTKKERRWIVELTEKTGPQTDPLIIENTYAPQTWNGAVHFLKGREKAFHIISKQDEKKIELAGFFKHDELIISASYIPNDGADQLAIWILTSGKSTKNHLFLLDAQRQLIYIGYSSINRLGHDIRDTLGNFWIPHHEGLVKINPAITYFPSSNPDMVKTLHAIVEDGDGAIWFAGYEDGLAYWKDGILSKYNADKELPYRYLPGAFKFSAEEAFLLTEQNPPILRKALSGKWEGVNIQINGESTTWKAYLMDTLEDGRIGIGMQNGGLAIVENDLKHTLQVKLIDAEKGLSLQNVLCFSQDQKGRIWSGRSSIGVAIYDEALDTAYTFRKLNAGSQGFGAMSMDIDNQDRLWMGTSNGLYVLENASEFNPVTDDFFNQCKWIKLPNGDHSLVASLKIINDSLIVFGNSTAINFLFLSDYNSDPDATAIYQLLYGSDIQGGGSEQNAIMVDSKGFLWVGSHEGANRIDLSQLIVDQSKPKIEFKRIETGKGQIEIVDGQIALPVDSRNVRVAFGPDRNPSFLKNIFYDFSVISERRDTMIQEMHNQDGQFELNYLPPGTYTLNISAKKHGQVIDTENINIKVPMALGENPLWWTLLTALFLGGIGFIIYLRNRNIRNLLEKDLILSQLKNDRDHLQIQTIISSFNPHFINNSLHWAQSRYHQDQTLVKLIGRLSENIRYIFDHTRKGKAWHSLEKELDLVDNYITIQQIRFKDNFIFERPKISELSKLKDIRIPLMQIQIHVENAIEHGIRNREGSSHIKIEIIDMKDSIEIVVTDDGAGRIKAQSLNSSGTQTGTKMLNALHDIFNQNALNQKKITTVYKDDIFCDASGSRYGTSVTISIPKQFNYEV